MRKKQPSVKHQGMSRLLSSSVATFALLALSSQAFAQDVTIDTDREDTVRTSTAGDGGTPANVSIASGSTITAVSYTHLTLPTTSRV